MQDNQLSIETRSDSTDLDPVDEGLPTPALRRDLEAAAPQLLNKFESTRLDRKHQLEEAGRRYKHIKAKWAKEKATFLSDLGQGSALSDGASSGGSDRSRLTDSSSSSFQSNLKPQATTKAKQRVALSTSTSSRDSQASLQFKQPAQHTTQAKVRAPLSTSTTSSPVSLQFEQGLQATTKAKVRVPLSTSTTSIRFDQPAQATTKAKVRVPLSTSTDSNPPGFEQGPQATTQARQRVALSTSTDSNPISPRFGFDQQPQATTQTKQRVPLSASSDSNPLLSLAEQLQVTTKAKQRVPLSTSTDSNPLPHPTNQAPDITQSRTRLPQSSTTSTIPDSDSTSSTTSSARARRALTSTEAVLKMQIQIRLIPVIKLLTASVTTPATRAQANARAHAALKHAIDNNASPPLAARCAFYIAHTTYDPTDKTTTQNAVNWFHRAREAAEHDYPEGQWAQEWLNRYESLNMVSRPSTSSSWLSTVSNNLWNTVFRKNSNPEDMGPALAPPLKPRPAPLWQDENARVANHNRAKGLERIPSFTTWNSGETPSPTSAEEEEASAKPPSAAKDARSATPSFNTQTSSSSPALSAGTKDYHGLQWSPGHLYGKGAIVPGQGEFQLVFSPANFSPDRVRPDPEVELPVEISEDRQRANALMAAVYAGDASPSALSFRSRRLRNHNRQAGPSWDEILDNLDYYLPPGGKVLRIVNRTSNDGESSSPDGTMTNPIDPTGAVITGHLPFSFDAGGSLSLSMFPPPDPGASRSQDQFVYLPYRPPPSAGEGEGELVRAQVVYLQYRPPQPPAAAEGELHEVPEEGGWFDGVAGELTEEERAVQ
jgi:hypothetical protein